MLFSVEVGGGGGEFGPLSLSSCLMVAGNLGNMSGRVTERVTLSIRLSGMSNWQTTSTSSNIDEETMVQVQKDVLSDGKVSTKENNQ